MKATEGKEMVDEVAEEPNIDQFYDRNPAELSDADWLLLIEIERKNRAMFIEKKKK